MDPAQYPWAYLPNNNNVSFDQQQLENGGVSYFGLPVGAGGQQMAGGGGHTTVAAAGAAQQKQLQHEAALKAAAAANAAAVASSSGGNAGAEAMAAAEKAAAELKHPEGQKTRSKIVRLILVLRKKAYFL
jgi:hypothetical protein